METQQLNADKQDEFQKAKVKGFLANERTFIKWMQLSIVVSGLSLTMLNFGSGKYSANLIAMIIQFGALAIILSSYFSFIARAQKISNNERGSFHNQFLPVCVIVFFVFTSAIIFAFTIKRIQAGQRSLFAIQPTKKIFPQLYSPKSFSTARSLSLLCKSKTTTKSPFLNTLSFSSPILSRNYSSSVTPPSETISSNLDSIVESSAPAQFATDLSSSIDQLSTVASEVSMKIGDLKAIGLANNTPVGWVEQLLELSHVYTGLPWWGTILTATLVVRLSMFPINVILQRKVVKMQNLQPKMVAIKAKLERAQKENNMYEYRVQATQMRKLMKDEGVNPFSTVLLPLMQMPVMVSFFMALREMSSLPVEHLKTGGMLWFTDLTVADPLYILPIIAAASMISVFEITRKFQNAIQQPKVMVWALRGVGIVMAVVTIKFQTSIFVYFITNNIFSALQAYLMAQPGFKRFFKIPDIKKVMLAQTPKNAFVKTIESTMKKLKS
ncbi:hypothetical protein BB558_004306 [Smittium angustum]|uniref:Uncharacterized protein n=1 Tax=Smittium angustum TaxID=133377 RepID=A0A2U1J3Q1_SMIAN|nr:hypothetical protein BB558_004306 [Smittium angustum]